MTSTPKKKKIYVSNLTANMEADDLRSLFESHGLVFSAKVVVDEQSGLSRGFGFVEMEADAALDAILSLDNREFCGQKLEIKAI